MLMIAGLISSDRLRGRTPRVNKEHVNTDFISWGQQWSSVAEREKLTSFSGQTLALFLLKVLVLIWYLGPERACGVLKVVFLGSTSTARNWLVGASVAVMC